MNFLKYNLEDHLSLNDYYEQNMFHYKGGGIRRVVRSVTRHIPNPFRRGGGENDGGGGGEVIEQVQKIEIVIKDPPQDVNYRELSRLLTYVYIPDSKPNIDEETDLVYHFEIGTNNGRLDKRFNTSVNNTGKAVWVDYLIENEKIKVAIRNAKPEDKKRVEEEMRKKIETDNRNKKQGSSRR